MVAVSLRWAQLCCHASWFWVWLRHARPRARRAGGRAWLLAGDQEPRSGTGGQEQLDDGDVDVGLADRQVEGEHIGAEAGHGGVLGLLSRVDDLAADLRP